MDTPEVVEHILAHTGVKGMKWGVRRSEVHPDIAHIPKKTRKEASKDAEEFTRAKLFFGVGAGTRRKLIKAKVEAKKVKDPLYAKAFDHFVKQTDLGQRASQARSERKRKDVTKQVKRTTKKVGRILGPYLSNNAGYHSSEGRIQKLGLDYTNDILVHTGVKGMKWGVRKSASARTQAFKESRARAKSSEVTVSDKRKKLKTTGGVGRPAHPDAVRARTLGQVGKGSGAKALSNADLRVLNERLNLEQNYSRLTQQDKSSGRKFVNKALGRKDVQQGIKSQVTKKRMAKGAAVLAFKIPMRAALPI